MRRSCRKSCRRSGLPAVALALALAVSTVPASVFAGTAGTAQSTGTAGAAHTAGTAQAKADPFLQKEKESARYQYQLEATKAQKAWSILEKMENRRKVTVAILDTGVDPGHEDLQKNLKRTKKGGAGYVRIVAGKPVRGRDDMDAENGHGTHVTGIIGATYHNGKGGSGIASGHNNDLMEVLPVGISSDGNSIFTADIVAGIRYAVSQGADVINLSFESVDRDRILEAAIKDAFYNHHVIFVSSSGNEAADEPSYPADMREVIAVNASDYLGDTGMYWSNYGEMKDITAPGTSILSTLPGDRYGVMTGTSMASPVAAGIAGLVRAANPDLTPDQVRNILCATTSQKGEFKAKSTAYGIVDAEAAVKAARAASASVPAESVSLKRDRLTMTQGDDAGLNALVMPATSLQMPAWESSDEKVVTVDAYGNLKAVGVGEAVVTVRAGGSSASCRVTVEPAVSATKLKIRGVPRDGEMEEYEALSLNAEILPENASNREVYWSSDNPGVALAYEYGFVEARHPGKAVITARTADGRVTASVRITVRATAVRLKFTKTLPWLFQGEKGRFAGRLLDAKGRSNVAHRQITWSSSNRRIARVNSKTGKITALRPGKFYVKASNFDGYVTANRQVIVAKKKYAGKADYNLHQTKAGKKQATIAWKKIPVAAGYQVQEKVKTGKGTYRWKNERTMKASAKSITIKGKSRRTFRVRAYYKRKNAVRYFGWSNAVTTRPAGGK